MSYTPKDKVFAAAAKKLQALTDEQIGACAEVAFARRKLGVEKELGDVALDKGFLTPETLTRIMTVVAKHEARKRAGSSAGGSSEEMQPIIGAGSEKRPATPPTPREPSAGWVGRGSPPPGQEPLRIDPTPPPPGASDDLIEGFSVGERIGEGAMAAVFRARHRTLDKPVALKILFTQHSQNADYIARFMREARAAARIDHPNVVRISDAGESKGRHYIAMELVEGLNLEKAIARDGPLSELAAIEVATGVARALEAAHQEKLIHRDVKPANIVRTPDGRVKLLDLGLARTTHRTGEDGFITDHGKTLGTPFYVSPEQARGQELDIRTDIYSLGITLYFLVTGEHPFIGNNPVDVMRKHISEPLPSVRKLRPALSSGFETVLSRMLEKDRKKRPETPKDLVQLLEELRAGSGEKDDPKRRPGAKAAPRKSAAEIEAEKEEARAARAAGVAALPPPRNEIVIPAQRTTTTRLVFAGAALTVALMALLGLRAALGPPVSASEIARAEEERLRRASRPIPVAASVAEVSVLPPEWVYIERRVRENIEGKPQEALADLRKMVPIEKRTGAMRAAFEQLESAIQRSVAERFEADIARAAEFRKQGGWEKAKIIYGRRIPLYGGPAEKARAEQEMVKLEAEEKADAAAAAGRRGGAGEGERAALKSLLLEVAPLVRAGNEDRAEERMRAIATTLAGERAPPPGSAAELVSDGAKLVGELMLLDGMVAKAIGGMAGHEERFILSTGESIEGTVGAVDAQGRVTVEKEGKAPAQFLVRSLSGPDKERLAVLGRGRGPDLERLLVIAELYSGERNLALARAEELGSPALLEHVKRVIELAGKAGVDRGQLAGGPGAGGRRKPVDTGEDPLEPSSEPGTPAPPPETPKEPAPPPPPKEPPPPPKPKEPEAPKIATPLDRVLEEILKIPFQSEKGRGFSVKYEWQPGAEAGLDDWRFDKQPLRRPTMTAKGLQIECTAKQPLRLLHKVPMGTSFTYEFTFQVEQKSPQTKVSLVFADGKGGTSYAVECGEALVKRQRGETIQELKRPTVPVSDVLKLNADMTVILKVQDDEVSVERSGKKVFEKVRAKDAGGVIGIEITDGTVILRSISIRGEPDSLWVADEFKKIKAKE